MPISISKKKPPKKRERKNKKHIPWVVRARHHWYISYSQAHWNQKMSEQLFFLFHFWKQERFDTIQGIRFFGFQKAHYYCSNCQRLFFCSLDLLDLLDLQDLLNKLEHLLPSMTGFVLFISVEDVECCVFLSPDSLFRLPVDSVFRLPVKSELLAAEPCNEFLFFFLAKDDLIVIVFIERENRMKRNAKKKSKFLCVIKIYDKIELKHIVDSFVFFFCFFLLNQSNNKHE